MVRIENNRHKDDINIFKAFLAPFDIKQFKLALSCIKPCTQHYLVYIIVLKWLEPKTIVICLKLRAKLCLWCFYAFFALCHTKWYKRALFCIILGIQHYFVYIIVLKWLEFKTIVICFILYAMLRFWCFKAFLALCRIKWFKLGLFITNLGTKHYLVYINFLKW